MLEYSFFQHSSSGWTISIGGIIAIIGAWFIFKKFNEPGWKSIIPVYNLYILFKYTWGQGWYFLFLLIPIVNIVIAIMTYSKLSKAFGHGVGFTLGLIFLNPIFMLILGLNDDAYRGYPL